MSYMTEIKGVSSDEFEIDMIYRSTQKPTKKNLERMCKEFDIKSFSAAMFEVSEEDFNAHFINSREFVRGKFFKLDFMITDSEVYDKIKERYYSFDRK